MQGECQQTEANQDRFRSLQSHRKKLPNFSRLRATEAKCLPEVASHKHVQFTGTPQFSRQSEKIAQSEIFEVGSIQALLWHFVLLTSRVVVSTFCLRTDET